MISSEIVYDEGFKPGYLGRMIQMQGEYYDVVWAKPRVSFEVMMAREMCNFHDMYVSGRDLLLTAHLNKILIGHIAVVSETLDRPGARLRWFHVEGKYQGCGIGRELLTCALKFCSTRGYSVVWLWTMEGLDSARHLYDSFGFQPTADVDIPLPFHGTTLELKLE